jgi:hypothetical protein
MTTKLRNIILAILAAVAVFLLTTQPIEKPPATQEEPTPYPTTIAGATNIPAVQPLPTGNLFNNPDFEDGFEHKTELNSFGNILEIVEFNAPIDWNIAYCYTDYMPELCNAPDQGINNPMGLMMRRPEFAQGNLGEKGPNYPTGERVYSGEYSAKWFCSWGVCAAGLYQTVPTVAGETYKVTAYFQSWCNQDTSYASKTDSNCWVQIRAHLAGDPSAAFLEDSIPVFKEENVVQVLDSWHLVTYEFVANSKETTIFFLGYNTWPYENNNWWLDHATIKIVG